MANQTKSRVFTSNHKSYIDSAPSCFWPMLPKISEADFVLLGAPMDETTLTRPGSRCAPNAIRASLINFDSYSERAEIDLEDVKIHDLGDVFVVHCNVNQTLKRIERLVRDLIDARKIPVLIGGEHAITLGSARALDDAAILDFDAHMDARDQYPHGLKLSHATVMRRITDEIGPNKICQVGIRTYCKQELEYAKSQGFGLITANEVNKNGLSVTVKKIRDKLEGFKKIYITIDIDALDAPYTPGATYPSPEGITPTMLLDILAEVIDKRVVGFDLVEVSPPYDVANLTVFNATKIILETIALIQKARFL